MTAFFFLGCIFHLHAQEENDTLLSKHHALNEVVVFANKFAEKFKRIAQTVDVLTTSQQLTYQNNTADVLINSGKVFVQKSQQGGGSPVIRGFEASRILLMVDGVRMNNAIYRSGHLQNIISVDNMVLDRLEVIYGPSSTLYGSDALGGVINMFTKKPKLSDSNKTLISGNTTLRYANAVHENRGNFQLNIGGKKWASLTSFTYGSFGDVVQGKNRLSAYPDFGKKDFLVVRSGNSDLVVPNANPDNQTPIGYRQIDLMQKVLFKPNEKISHLFNFQLSNTNDLPRYDRSTEKDAGGKPVYAEWYYGPQFRSMASYHFNATKQVGFFQDIQVVANVQQVEESRMSRKFQNNNKDFRWEKVHVFGVTADAKHSYGKNELHLGAESYINFVQSTAERKNIATGAASRITTRYADGPTNMSYHALYAQHTYKINDNWTINDGLRLNLVRMDARFVDTSLTKFPFTRATQSHSAVTGNFGIVYASSSNLKLSLELNSGFRSPNVDDLAKVFDSRTGMVVVPNIELKPEYTYNTSFNLQQFGDGLNYGLSVFYTLFKNALVLDKSTFNGQDSILYSGVKSAVYAMQNKAKAQLFGFSMNASYFFTKNMQLEGVVTYTKGKFTDPLNGNIPLDHVPPVYGKVSFKQSAGKWKTELYTLFNGWKKLADYNPNGEDNLQYATVDGMPSWITFNTRLGFQFNEKLSTQVLLENIFDKNYRYFASGVSAPGRNCSITLRASF